MQSNNSKGGVLIAVAVLALVTLTDFPGAAAVRGSLEKIGVAAFVASLVQGGDPCLAGRHLPDELRYPYEAEVCAAAAAAGRPAPRPGP